MNWWNILEIPYDSDLKTIKKAYAKLLKIYHPEEDAEGYQRLRKAYDEAVKYTKQNIKNQDKQELSQNTFVVLGDNKNIMEDKLDDKKSVNSPLNLNKAEAYEKQNKNHELFDNINDFVDRLGIIYKDMSLRIDKSEWEKLLNMEAVWNAYSFPIIENILLKFLVKHKNLPTSIWSMLNDNFNWVENERRLYDKYSTDIVNELISSIKRPNPLKYDCLKSLRVDIEDEYLFLRKEAYEALEAKDYHKAEKNLNLAYSLFKDDGELLRLIGKYNYCFNKLDKALEFYKLAFEKNENDLESALFIGIILCLNECFIEALSYLKLYLSINNNDKLALYSIAYCNYYSNDLASAKDSFVSFINIAGKNKISSKYLKNIEAQLVGKRTKKINFSTYKYEIREEIKNGFVVQKRKSLDVKNLVRSVMLFLLIVYVLIAAFNNRMENHYDYKKAQVADIVRQTGTQISEDLRDDEIFKAMNSKDNLKNIRNFLNIKMRVKDIQPLEYYKLSEVVNDKIILSKEEIDNNNFQDKIESQLYMGTFDDGVIIFSDNNYSKDSLESDQSYIVKGAISTLGFKSIIEIKNKYTIKNFYWPKDGAYIDCSSKEIERVKKDGNLIEVRNGIPTRVSKTAQDFIDNDYPGVQALYLTDITPIDLYVSVDEGDKFTFFRKEELSESDLANSIQAFVGKIDGVNIMFIDNKFSIKDLDGNKGSTICGYGYKFKVKEPIDVPIKQGKYSEVVSIAASFLYSKSN